MVSDVGKQVRTYFHEGETIAVYEFEGVNVIGDFTLRDFKAVKGIAVTELKTGEELVQIGRMPGAGEVRVLTRNPALKGSLGHSRTFHVKQVAGEWTMEKVSLSFPGLEGGST